jgi:hypothetical protein
VTLAVFVAVVAGAYVQRQVVVAWLASMDPLQHVPDAASLPARFWLSIAVRLAIFAAAAPLAAEGWIFVCRLRNAPVQARLWPAFCLATTLTLAGALALTWHFSDALRHSLVYLSDARVSSLEDGLRPRSAPSTDRVHRRLASPREHRDDARS